MKYVGGDPDGKSCVQTGSGVNSCDHNILTCDKCDFNGTLIFGPLDQYTAPFPRLSASHFLAAAERFWACLKRHVLLGHQTSDNFKNALFPKPTVGKLFTNTSV